MCFAQMMGKEDFSKTMMWGLMLMVMSKEIIGLLKRLLGIPTP